MTGLYGQQTLATGGVIRISLLDRHVSFMPIESSLGLTDNIAVNNTDFRWDVKTCKELSQIDNFIPVKR
jgi:hypothetical protein